MILIQNTNLMKLKKRMNNPHCGYGYFTKFDDETDEGEIVITLSEEIERLERRLEKYEKI